MEIEGKYKEIMRTIPNSECELRYIELEEIAYFSEDNKMMNKLLFILDGELKIRYNGIQEKKIAKKEFGLIPKESEWYGETSSGCRMIILRFKKVNNIWNKRKIERLLDAYPRLVEDSFPVLEIKRILQVFLDLLEVYMLEKDAEKSLFTLKDEELFSLLYAIYPCKDLARLLFPVLREDADFKSLVKTNHLKVENVSGLAELAGCSLVTLNRKFREHFNVTAYQWIMHNRTMKVRARLRNSNVTLGEIAQEFGFHSSTELDRFCRRQLGITARKIRFR